MPDKTSKITHAGFVFRVKLGDYEVEIGGTREEVLKSVEDLPNLITSVDKAFQRVRPRKVATLTVKTEPAKDQKALSQKYPKVLPTEKSDQAILRLLETDWGKWRPRTIDEVKDALKANGMDYSAHILTGVLINLVRKGRIRRWNTDAGYVYILAEKEASDKRGDAV